MSGISSPEVQVSCCASLKSECRAGRFLLDWVGEAGGPGRLAGAKGKPIFYCRFQTRAESAWLSGICG